MDTPKDDRDFHQRNADVYAEVHALRRMLIAIVSTLGEGAVVITREVYNEVEKYYRLDVTEHPHVVNIRVEKLQ